MPHVAARLLIEVKSNITKKDLVESLTRLSGIKQKLRASWPQKGHRSYTLASVVGVTRKGLSRDTIDSAIRSAPAVGNGLDLVDHIVVLDSHLAIAMRPNGHYVLLSSKADESSLAPFVAHLRADAAALFDPAGRAMSLSSDLLQAVLGGPSWRVSGLRPVPGNQRQPWETLYLKAETLSSPSRQHRATLERTWDAGGRVSGVARSLGTYAIDELDLPGATKWLSEAVKLDDDPDAHRILADIAGWQGDFASALSHQRSAAKASIDRDAEALQIAYRLTCAGRQDDALDLIDGHAERQNDLEGKTVLRVHALVRGARTAEAAAVWRSDGKHVVTPLGRALALACLRDDRGCERALREVLESALGRRQSARVWHLDHFAEVRDLPWFRSILPPPVPARDRAVTSSAVRAPHPPPAPSEARPGPASRPRSGSK